MTQLVRLVALALCLLFLGTALPAPAADAPGAIQKASVSAPASAKTAASAAVKTPININTASAKDLTKLEGIGDTTAKAIVDFRTKNGPFKAPEDLMKVKGIGEKKYAAVKGLITVQ